MNYASHLECWGGPIAPISIQATNFGLKNDMIQQVQNSCRFHGLSGNDANNHLDKFLHVTQSIKVNGLTDDAFRLYLFPYSLTHHATVWFDRLPRNSINPFEQMAKMFLTKYFPPSMVTKLKNEIINFLQRLDESLFKAWECYKLLIDRCPNHNMLPVTQIDTFYNGLTLKHRDTINATAALKAKMAEINKNLMRVLQVNQQVKAVTPNCETCGGPHSYTDCPATVGQTQNVYAVGSYQDMQTNVTSLTNSNLELKNMFGQFMKMNTASSLSSRTLPSNMITNPKEDLKGITTRSGTAYQVPTILTTSSSLSLTVERETKETNDKIILKTRRDLIDVFEGELTLHVGKEAITFNLDQTSRYSANYNDMTENQIDVIDMACEEYSLISTLKGDILLLEAFLNDDPSLPPPNQGNYLPQVQKELKIYEATSDKSSIDEPLEVKLNDLPPHLEYAFLEGDDKLPVIIAKDTSDEEETALITILKSHKQAIAWKLSDIKSINPEFYTHKILMEEDFKPAIQHH
uniref:Retrotransposon gag domain-containing protein n=1 Tax=Tanacetum cinerariifolium TaxID=118510 RepID=A0A6L2JPV3_TANCI|nr:hypothetical protein [Tanacetum cinerariifolium]